MLIEPDWLNMLDRGDNKVALLKLTKYGFAAAHWTLGMVVFIDRDANVNHGRPFGWLAGELPFISRRKMLMTDAIEWPWIKTGI